MLRAADYGGSVKSRSPWMQHEIVLFCMHNTTFSQWAAYLARVTLIGQDAKDELAPFPAHDRCAKAYSIARRGLVAGEEQQNLVVVLVNRNMPFPADSPGVRALTAKVA